MSENSEPTQEGETLEHTTPVYTNPYDNLDAYGLPELPPPPPKVSRVWKTIRVSSYVVLALVLLAFSFGGGVLYTLSTHPSKETVRLLRPSPIVSTPIIKTVLATPQLVPTYISFGETALQLFQNIHGTWYTTINDFNDPSYVITFYGRDPDTLATTAINFLNSPNNKQQYLAEPPSATSALHNLCNGVFVNGIKWEVDGQYNGLASDNTCGLLQSLP